MLTDIDKQLMISFIQRNYPVSRVKDKQRFKRGVIMDDGSVYLVSDKAQRLALYFKLIETLNIVFNSDDVSSRIVLNSIMLFNHEHQ